MLTFELKIVLESPANIALPDGNIARDSRGRLQLRAAFLRGLHRASAEKVALALELPVCGATTASQMCQPLRQSPDGLCMVCRIFGSAWSAGRIFHRDLIATSATPYPETRTRARVAHGRFTGTYTTTREVLPTGTTFTGTIDHLLEDKPSVALALASLRAIRVIGSGAVSGYGLCQVEARALDSAQRPLDDRDLVSTLASLQTLYRKITKRP